MSFRIRSRHIRHQVIPQEPMSRPTQAAMVQCIRHTVKQFRFKNLQNSRMILHVTATRLL